MAPSSPATVSDLETRIRDFIIHPRLQHSLLRDKPKWHVLTSALDVIGDTELAIAAYKMLPEPGDHGMRYLILYGILQVLFVQQDAARHVLESLDIPYPGDDPDITFVREIRNDATGHPTKRDAKPKRKIPQTSNYIARFSLQSTGFLLFTESADDNDRQIQVNLSELIGKQDAGIIRLLKAAAVEVWKREEAHRMTFKDTKLAAIFDHQLNYYLQKISEGCGGDDNRKVFACLHVNMLIKMLDEFRAALLARGALPAYDNLKHEIEYTEYPLAELKKYFGRDPLNTLNDKSSYIFSHFLRRQFQRLSESAVEIDKDYEQETPSISGA